MHATQVYKRIQQRVGERGHRIDDRMADAGDYESLRDGAECTHLVYSHEICRAVLEDAERFVPAPIAAAVERIGQRFGIDMGALNRFLSGNPMQAGCPRHAALRRRFLTVYAAAMKATAGRFRPAAEETFVRLKRAAPTSLVGEVAAPYVDAALRRVLESEGVPAGAYDVAAGDAGPILEYLHHPRKLAHKSAQAAAFLEALPDRLRADDWPPILLSYVLQGRDPMVGGITAFLHDFIACDGPEREALAAAASATQMFRDASPVNYIGRVAQQAGHIGALEVAAGDHLVLMLPWANAHALAAAGRGVAFGGGAHVCAGQALAVAIGDAFLDALRTHHAAVDWSALQPDTVVPAVFRQYREGAA